MKTILYMSLLIAYGKSGCIVMKDVFIKIVRKAMPVLSRARLQLAHGILVLRLTRKTTILLWKTCFLVNIIKYTIL